MVPLASREVVEMFHPTFTRREAALKHVRGLKGEESAFHAETLAVAEQMHMRYEKEFADAQDVALLHILSCCPPS